MVYSIFLEIFNLQTIENEFKQRDLGYRIL